MNPSAELLKPTESFAHTQAEGTAGLSYTQFDDLAAPSLATLTVCTVGLSPEDQRALEHLFFGEDQRSPRLYPVDQALHATADIILIDGRNPLARDWWRARRAVLRNRPMVWMAQRSPHEAHTTLVLPVVWSLLPLILFRAAQAAPRHRAVAERSLSVRNQALMVVASHRMAAAQLRWMLETLKFRVTVASSAREGLAALHAAPYAGVIVAQDDQERRLDIARICQRIRRLDRRLGRVPVLVVNKELSAWQRLRLSLFGAVEFAPWPRHALELQAALARLPVDHRSSDQDHDSD